MIAPNQVQRQQNCSPCRHSEIPAQEQTNGYDLQVLMADPSVPATMTGRNYCPAGARDEVVECLSINPERKSSCICCIQLSSQ